MSDVEIDCVGMQPPEPMEKALDALSALQKGQRLVLRLDREPHPLLRMLDNNAYRWQMGRHDAVVTVTVWQD